MITYIAILRGINVSGQKKIKMADLRELLNNSGLEDLQTYIQSGNIIFKSSQRDSSKLAQLIKSKISEHYDFEVPVIIRDGEDWQSAIARNPFTEEKEGVDLQRVGVTFLENEPNRNLVSEIEERDYSPDEFVIDGKEIYLHCPTGFGKTKLTNNFFESKLKVTATTRNWKTVNTLIAMAGEQD